MKIYETKDGKSYMLPFVLVTSLFFLWGFAHAILEVLNPHFKQLIHLSNEKAAWVQAATYAAYFLMALPAGWIIRKHGYRGGVLTGLCLYGVGALLFLPICLMQGMFGADVLFNFFVAALFVLGCGLTCLETSANPYITVLGDPQKAETRINLSQSLNGLGQICGPLIGGLVFFGGASEAAAAAESDPSVMSVAIPYTVMGIAVLLVALLFKRSELPEVNDEAADTASSSVEKPLYRRPLFVFGVLCLGLYCAAQTGVNANFIAYVLQCGIEDMDAATASRYLAVGGMGLFMLGRMIGAWLMQYIKAEHLLTLQALGAALASLIVIYVGGYVAMYALFFIYLMESIMFPTIFAISLRGLSASQTKLASSFLIMSIVLGGVAPLIMGRIADNTGSLNPAFWVPCLCYLFIVVFALCQRGKAVKGAAAVVACLLLTVSPASAQYLENVSQKAVANEPLSSFEAERSQLFNFGWRFHYGAAEPSEVTALGFDDSLWRPIDLPHDFQFEQPWLENGSKGRGFKEMGEGWYRKSFVADEKWRGKQVLLDFGGIMYVGDVYVNGSKVAESEYGYVGFEVDVTRHLRFGEENVVAVWASTCKENASRWYTGGGLFRDVFLKLRNSTHITRHGLYITTPEIDAHKAVVEVQVEVENWRGQNISLEATLCDAEGRVVGSSRRVEPDHLLQSCTEMPLPSIEVAEPHLWDIDDPYLYSCTVVLKSGDKVIDSMTDQFGVRSIEFGPDFGFKLNGRKVFLQGMANHHDMGALGVAAFDSGIERIMRQAKAFGFNCIRCSHNPYSRNFTRIADRVGLLIVDELIDKWSDDEYWGGRKPFMQIWPGLMAEYIKRDRNSPSVILWSLGNELQTRTAWSGYQTGDWGITTYRIFDAFVKRYDATRKTTVAQFPARAGAQRGTPDFDTYLVPPELGCATEVASFNYQWRAYKGYYEHKPDLILFQSEAVTNELLAPFFGMDWQRGVGLAYWGAIEYWGESQGWPKKGWDFSYFRHTMEPYPQAYLIASAYKTDEPVVRIGVADQAGESLDWNDVKVGKLRLSENWNLSNGRKVTLYTFTNADEVELQLNGKRVGVKSNDRSSVHTRNIICWPDLDYGKGGTVTAVAYSDGKEVARHELRTSQPASALRIVAESQAGCLSDRPAEWDADGMELQYLTVEAVDSRGQRVCTDNHPVTVEVTGAADLYALDNGDHYTQELFTPDIRTKQLHDGTLQVILRSRRGMPGKVQVVATAPGLRKSRLLLQTK